MMKHRLTILLTILLIGFVGVGINDLRNNQVQLELKEIKLQDQALELREIRLQKETLNKKFEDAIKDGEVNEKKVRQLEQEKLQLEERTRQLETELQAKRETTVAGASSFQPTGNKQDWLEASGIPESEWWAVDFIVSRESGWNPCAYNPGKSDCNLTAAQVNATHWSNSVACGLGQSKECGKWGLNWTDPINQLKHMNIYVNRYGGWAGAVSYWQANGHY